MKNLDNIEKYLLDNRAAFDTEVPRTEAWEGIAQRLGQVNNIEQFIKTNRSDFDTATPSLKIWSTIEERIESKDAIELFIAKNRAEFDTHAPSERVWAGVDQYLKGNHLEKYVRENRYDFDSELPNLKVWANVERTLHPQKKSGKTLTISWLRRAAAAIALLVMGVGIGLIINKKTEKTILVETVAPEFNEAEQFYSQKVQSQMTKLAGYNPDPSVLTDLKRMDEIYGELKAELELTPSANREEIVRRLIQSYQSKVGILERVLNDIEEHQIESQKKQQQNGKI